MTPRVTVLLAVKDGERYVRGAVESVLEQTYGDFELLVVDDASTDATPQILASFSDPRIRVVRNKRNLGQVPSLNLGLAQARGEYVARLDADDACRPERLARQVEQLDADGRVGLVGTWMEIVGERDQRLGWLRKALHDYVDFLYHTLIMRVYVSHPSAMYRREPVLALGGYDETTAPAEDKDLWRKLALERWDARIVPEPLVVYRLHPGQLSQTQAAHQREVDGLSQDRFLAALAPQTPPTPVRLLLASDPRTWQHDPRRQLDGLEAVLGGARTILRLGDDEARRLELRVAARLLAVARTRPWHPAARVLGAYALARLPAESKRRARASYAAALATTPLLAALRRSGRLVADRADAVPVLRGLRGPARHSRLARSLYGKLLGTE
ncbi:MAG TPA: glycosyltransferase family 2 protein [Gaiellaceae bacterium]|nr:glycosyltransferase family 2 protein [Gaiellaceae bacterium]